MMLPHADLAALAVECIGFERMGRFKPDAARHATRDMLTDRARELGISDRNLEQRPPWIMALAKQIVHGPVAGNA